MAKWIYKLVTKQQWNAALEAGKFEGAPVDLEDGFIHFSTGEQVEETAIRHFNGIDDLLLLVISLEMLEERTDPVTWEPSRGGALFPHLYCPMPLEAVIALAKLPMNEDGSHSFPPLPEE